MKNLARYLTSAAVGLGLFVNLATAKAETLSGKVYDALTSETMKGFPIQLDNNSSHTDQNGNYTFDVPVGNHHFKVSDNVTRYFNYEEDVSVSSNLEKNVWMIPVREVNTQYWSDFLAKLKYLRHVDGSAANGNTIIHNWQDQYRPIPIWYNEQQAIDILGQDSVQKYFNGCDIAIQEWEEKSGIDLFQRVYQDPTIGIGLDYSKNGAWVDYIEWFPDNTPKKFNVCIGRSLISYDQNTIRRYYEHELGHCFMLTHSPDPNDNMNPLTIPNISENETDIVHIIYTLPNFIDMNQYNPNKVETKNSVKEWNLYE